MMNLYIIRHGIAEDLGANNSYDDSQRALTEAGRKKMRSIAEGLLAFGVKLDLILTSPYLRARETAEILAEVFETKDKLVFSKNLIPLADPVQLVDEITEKHQVNSLAVVGHEPALSSLTSILLSGQPYLNITMKKGGVCHLSTDKVRVEGGATLEWLLTPSQLVKLGE
jgi:phosphohistidine phosphatase